MFSPVPASRSEKANLVPKQCACAFEALDLSRPILAPRCRPLLIGGLVSHVTTLLRLVSPGGKLHDVRDPPNPASQCGENLTKLCVLAARGLRPSGG